MDLASESTIGQYAKFQVNFFGITILSLPVSYSVVGSHLDKQALDAFSDPHGILSVVQKADSDELINYRLGRQVFNARHF